MVDRLSTGAPMTRPNFFLVGTTKGGTSTLHRWLERHPQIFLPARKELHYFCHCPDRGLNAIRSSDEYERIFSSATQPIVGEATPCYMYYPDVADAIHAEFPSSRILITLRDPVERFWSHYLMNEVYLPTGLPPEEIVDMNLRGEASTALDDLVGVGMYHDQVERFMSTFGHDSVLVTFLEDIAAEPTRVSETIQRFLEIPTIDLDTTQRDKQYVAPRNRVGKIALRNPWVRSIGVAILPWQVRRFLRTRILGDPGLKPVMSEDLRERLWSLYRSDSIKLEALLKRPLPWSGHR
ncbi:MAG: sulfotransferase domain-containing protein [Actinobacteria bacterium]|nr:sulfotransferase domain-containing protein [Actinomycetota bacterium]